MNRPWLRFRGVLWGALLASYTFTASGAASAPQAPSQLCVNSKCAAVAKSTGVKWHPGHYVESGNFIYGSNISGAVSAAEADMQTVFTGNPGVAGYQLVISWKAIEDSQGTYDFSAIDTLRSYLAANFPGKRLGIYVMATNFWSTSCSDWVPSYILNGSAYGASPTSGSYGWWYLSSNGSNFGCKIAQWRQPVITRLQALMSALATHASPYGSGYTYDTDPFVESICWDEASMMLASGSDFNGTAYESMWEQLIAGMVSAWPHTNVLDLSNYIDTEAGSVNVTNADQAVGAAQSSPDTYSPASNATWGFQAYMGLLSGSTNWVGKGAAMNVVQYPDYQQASVAQIYAVSVLAGASAIYWGDNYGNWSDIAALIAASPIPTADTACPGTYTQHRGGCNTN